MWELSNPRLIKRMSPDVGEVKAVNFDVEAGSWFAGVTRM